MATTDSTNDLDYFPLAFAYDRLATAAKEHSPGDFCGAADSIDMVHVSMLRGLSYINYLLSHADDDTGDDIQRKMAQDVVSEVTALIARIVEHKNEAAIIRMIDAQSSRKVTAAA